MTITRKIQAEAIFHGTVIVEGRKVNKESDTFLNSDLLHFNSLPRLRYSKWGFRLNVKVAWFVSLLVLEVLKEMAKMA